MFPLMRRGPEPTLEVIVRDAARSSSYGYNDENIDTVAVQKCGLCHGEAFRRDNFKGATIRLVAELTVRR